MFCRQRFIVPHCIDLYKLDMIKNYLIKVDTGLKYVQDVSATAVAFFGNMQI